MAPVATQAIVTLPEAPDIDVEGLRGQKTSPAENMSHTRFAEEVQATQIQESLPCKAVIPITQKLNFCTKALFAF